MADPVVRLTVNVTPEVSGLLDELAKSMNTTKTQALAQAISTTASLYRSKDAGADVIVRNGNSLQDVILPKK